MTAPPAISAARLAEALAPALPEELRGAAPGLAALLGELAGGRLAPEAAGAALAADPRLKAALRALAGREVADGGALVSFGTGNQFGDVTIGDVVGGDKLVVSISLAAPRLSVREQRNREALLMRMRRAWLDGLRARAFAEVGRAPLALAVVPPGAVERALATEVQELAEAPPLPAAFDLPAAFEASGGALLLLGAPGAGKTLLLVELADALIARAMADETRPIPVILPLASWARQRRPLAEWLVEELAKQYDVPRAVGAAWRQADALLPLLDGLDEVDEEARAACVQAINAYRAEHFTPLLVCSRSDEYAALPLRLRLELAVEVQPLDAAGAEALLAGAGPGGAAARALLAADAELAALAGSPLMLAVAAGALAGEHASLPRGPAMVAGRSSLVAAYVERVFGRRSTALEMPRGTIESGLAWLARQMLAQRLSVFHLEDLQPAWLPSAGARRAYTTLDRAGGVLLLTLGWLAVLLPLSLAVDANVHPTDPWLAYMLGGALFGGTAFPHGRSVARIVRHTLAGAGGGFGVGVLLGGAGYVFDAQRRLMINQSGLSELYLALASAVSVGLSGALAGGMFGMLGGPPRLGPRLVLPVERVRWSIGRAVLSVPLGLVSGVVVGAGLGLLLALVLAPLSVMGAGLSPLAMIDDQGVGLTEVVIITALVLIATLALIGGLYGLLGGVVAGLEAGAVTPLARPGEGLRRSLRSALVSALFFMAAGAVVAGALNAFAALALRSVRSVTVTMELPGMLLSIFIFAVQVGVVGALSYGGFTVLSHLALRLLLWRGGQLPWRIEVLLAEASERALLRRVGGGYMFAHRIFLEHFARRDASPGERKE
ncbi:MAG: hypothetical protein OHK0015_00760 [Chloroflexi bacterium OHK40]